jgi:hypothetical protein
MFLILLPFCESASPQLVQVGKTHKALFKIHLTLPGWRQNENIRHFSALKDAHKRAHKWSIQNIESARRAASQLVQS